MIWTIDLPGFVPCPVNRLLNNHWAEAGRLKKHDREVISAACLAYEVQPAQTRRKVSLLVVWPKGKRSVDKDAKVRNHD